MSRYLRTIGVAFANPHLRRLQLAWAGSMLGSCAYLIALAIVAFRSGGAAAVGLVMLARMVAAAVAAPPLSALADHFPRRLVMASSDLLRAVLTAAVAILAAAHASTLVVYALAVVIAVVATVFRPAQAALVPALASTPEELTASNAVATTIESVGIFLGPGIGGLVLALAGTPAVFVLCVVAFLWSAALVWSIDEPARTEEEEDRTEEPAHTGLTAGLRILATTPSLLAVTVTYAAQAMVAGALTVFAVVLAIDVLGLGNAGVGYLDSAFGVGGILGGVAAVGLVGARRLAAAFAAGVLAWGLGVALLGAASSAVFVLFLLAGVGLGNTVVDVAAMTLLQRSAPDAVLGRVFGVIEGVLLGSLGLGSVLAPLAIHALGVRTALVVTGLLLPAVVAVTARKLAQLDIDPAVASRVALLRAHRIFAPLSDATLEQLARRIEPVAAAPGTEVIRQGDSGDRVYVVEAGELAVHVDGRAGAPLGPGDVFGEIALLRDVPRTASVRAVTACDLLTLGRDDFLAAVTGHARSAAEADVVMSARLSALRPGVVTT